MKTYKLNKDPIFGTVSLYATELVDGVTTGVHVNTSNNQEYLKWVAEGNTPEPADE
jgi:hypothetical protein